MIKITPQLNWPCAEQFVEGLHGGGNFRELAAFAIDQDGMHTGVARALDVRRRFIADMTGLVRRHTRLL